MSSTIISPKAEVSPKARIGEGCKIFPFVYIEDDVVIGDNLNGVNAQRFIHGFKREAQRHRHTVTNRKNDETTITMVADDKKATRVYLLKYDDRAYHFSDATITIVIVPK